VGELEIEKVRRDDRRICEQGEDLHLSATSRAEQRVHLIDTSEEETAQRMRDGLVGRPRFGGRCQHTVIAVPVDARWRDELGKSFEELKRREQDLGVPVRRRLGKAVEEPGVR
jgi:hypothetical protein